MGIKFDGTNVKNGSRVVANMKRSNELREGSSSGGKALGNIKRNNEIREGSSSGGKALCNIKDGKNIRLGSSSGGRTQIKLSCKKPPNCCSRGALRGSTDSLSSIR